MTTRCSNIPQQDRLRVQIIDHEIKSTVSIEISDRQSASGPRIRERITRRRSDSLKLPLHVSEKQRLLRVTRAPLMRFSGRTEFVKKGKGERLQLATSGGAEPFPYFFQGQLKHPRLTAQLLRTLSKVVATRFHVPAAM